MYQLTDAQIRRMMQPTLDPTRDIAQWLCPKIIGRNYDDLDPIKEAHLIFDVFAIASRIEFVELEVDTCFHPNLADVLYEPKLLLTCSSPLHHCNPEWHEKKTKPITEPRWPHLIGKGIHYE